jgi:hypothetical protein
VQYVVSLLFTAICHFIYSYVAVCRFCAVSCVIIVGFFLLFSNYSTYVFMLFLCLCSCFVCLLCILCILCFCIVLYTDSSSVYCSLFSYFSTRLPLAVTGWKPNYSKYISYHIEGSFVSNNTVSAPKHDWIRHITMGKGLQLAYGQVHKLHSMHHPCGSALWKTNGHIDCRHSF